MVATRLRSIAGLLALLPVVSGCSALSTMAYSFGAFLDPNHRECRDEVGSCALCGDPPSYPGVPGGAGVPGDMGVVQAGFGCPQCGNHGQATLAGGDLTGQVAEIREQTAELREALDHVSSEAAERSRALIQTRAEFGRVQNELYQVQRRLNDWEQSVTELQEEMRMRDRERMNSLNALLSRLERIVADNQLTE